MTNVIEITSRTPLSKPEIPKERKAQLYDRTLAGIQFLIAQLTLSRAANRGADKSRAQFCDAQIHELYKILWRMQVREACGCWTCGRDAQSCAEVGGGQ
jgi:hypothetical protein